MEADFVTQDYAHTAETIIDAGLMVIREVKLQVQGYTLLRSNADARMQFAPLNSASCHSRTHHSQVIHGKGSPA